VPGTGYHDVGVAKGIGKCPVAIAMDADYTLLAVWIVSPSERSRLGLIESSGQMRHEDE
jgi:hypothetical protein